ncbi:MAG TPA: DNA repair protein RadA [Actinomycetota bacterium]|nr:DNA repair protein RadA [Actinomycetota bacterium]
MKNEDRHHCDACGHESPRWFGKCPECGSWSSAKRHAAEPDGVVAESLASVTAVTLRLGTGIDEIDRILGGGLVRGSVNLLAGEPGVGKSTLLLQLLAGVASAGGRSLLVTAEESLDQVSQRAARLTLPSNKIDAVSTGFLQDALANARREEPDVLVVDSIQAIQDRSIEQGSGSLVQVRACSAELVALAKSSSMAMILVGHVTKDGAVAGPKTLEHIVDTVLSLEGERGGSLRLLRAMKNRFGSCEETGVFTMTPTGLHVVEDPSALLLADRLAQVSGSIVFPSIQGSRSLLVEIQALVNATNHVPPRRVALGLDQRRLALLLAVINKRTPLDLGAHEVFTAAAGGISVPEPAADLAICLALRSAIADVPINESLVALGEVGLGGEIRRVPNLRRRLIEASRLGFKRALVPARSEVDDVGLEVVEVKDVTSAFAAADACQQTRAA